MTGPRASRRSVSPLVGLGILLAAALCLGSQAVPSTSAGYVASVNNSTDTAASASYFKCVDALTADKSAAFFEYALGEPTGSTNVADTGATGTRPGAYRGTMTASAVTPIACPRDPGTAYQLDGSTSYVTGLTTQANPATFSVEIWFKTTVAGGKLIGFGNAATGASSNYDRHLYVNSAGRISFGSYNGAVQVVTSPNIYTDGAWHHAVGTMSSTTGMKLYLDGALVASNAAFTVAQSYTGYWRVGYDNLNGWTLPPTNFFFTGSLRYAGVYTTVLTQAQVTNHYAAGR
jgi:hypothetical protein